MIVANPTIRLAKGEDYAEPYSATSELLAGRCQQCQSSEPAIAMRATARTVEGWDNQPIAVLALPQLRQAP